MLEFFEHLLGSGPLAAVGSDDQRTVVVLLRGTGDLRRPSRIGFVFAFLFVRDLNEAEAELGDAIFEQALLFGREIASGFFLEHPEQVNGMPCQRQVHFVLVVAFLEFQQAQLHLGLHENGFDEEQEISRWDGKIGSVCHTNDNVIAMAGSLLQH